ncbi:YegP family protein [Alcanivorax mobilis]
MKSNAAQDERYKRQEASDGRHYFNLRAGNHEVIGTSQMYKDKGGMEKGIDSVKSNAPGATVVDKS